MNPACSMASLISPIFQRSYQTIAVPPLAQSPVEDLGHVQQVDLAMIPRTEVHGNGESLHPVDHRLEPCLLADRVRRVGEDEVNGTLRQRPHELKVVRDLDALRTGNRLREFVVGINRGHRIHCRCT